MVLLIAVHVDRRFFSLPNKALSINDHGDGESADFEQRMMARLGG
jgi:hypothetical protein